MVLAIAALFMLSLGGWFLAPVVTGRATPPVYSRDAAVGAVQRARASKVGDWAPERLQTAESMMRRGLAEHRRQEARLLPLRDFTLARETFRLTERMALEAQVEADRRRDVARSEADSALAEARLQIDEASEILGVLPFLNELRIMVQKARFHFKEAQAQYAVENYGAAHRGAELACAEAERLVGRARSLASRYADAHSVRTWRRWAEEAVDGSRRRGEKAILVYKESKRLELYDNGQLVRTYRADMGSNTLSRKLRAGDGATPEGHYRITEKKGAGQSRYHKALLLDYPNEEDRRRFQEARKNGSVPRGAKLGGLIEIHGEGGRGQDWTRGCVALSNGDMDDLFRRVSVGTRVTIVGGDGRGGPLSRLARNSNPRDEAISRSR